MSQSSTKRLCRKIVGSVTFVTALLVALAGGTCYYLTARTLLDARCGTLDAEVKKQAQIISETLERQRNWLSGVAEELEDLQFPEMGTGQAAEMLRELIAKRDRTNGNLTHPRAALDGKLITLEEPEQPVLDGQAPQDAPDTAQMEDVSEEDWYRSGQDGTSWLPPVQENGAWYVTLAVPLRVREYTGTLAADFMLDDLLRNVAHIAIMNGGYPILQDAGGALLSHPARNDGAKVPELPQSLSVRDENAFYARDYDGMKRYFAYATVDGTGWRLLYAIDRYTLLRPMFPLLGALAASVLLAAGLAALLTAWRLELLTDPLQEITRAVRDIGKGRYRVKIRYDADDEFGVLCREIETACASTGRWIDELSHILRRMAQGDFTIKTDACSTGDFAAISESIDHIAQALHSVFKQVNLTAKWALGGSHQISGVSGRLTAGIESQSNSVDELGKAATLMRHESNQNALSASRAQESALSVTAGLRESARQASFLRDSLKQADDAVRELSSYLDTIAQCTTQGRMLSISASAEAERIGDDAAAFSMAVDELRDLFVRAQTAARDAGALVEKARDALARTGGDVRKTAEALHDVTKKNGQTAEYLSRIASASQLQAQAAARMSKEVTVISVVIQSNTQLAEQFDFSCDALAEQAKKLSGMASAFYTRGEASDGEKSAPIIFDEDSGGFSVTEEK